MQYFIRELDDETFMLMSDGGQVIAVYDRVEDAVAANAYDGFTFMYNDELFECIDGCARSYRPARLRSDGAAPLTLVQPLAANG
jgi:hypothetical protein